ncbi:phosphoribosylformylglycinamidine synthase subunit PurQ [Hyphomicrobiales bacterium]|jgi:phosphoribosylformylglycinamidine synthase|nr:phosphoribosylformylglycinamidine synthase subunit PurQ [Hyphomicrobiales bacterium]MDA8892649.1 phosphoribosylformylglycinamidine synthase subunit PurQ [Hyphomicrobiales bacterium]MDA9034794.1 phosphoribosylformylglycinamidine synthase subunit PurQ [Hyphomicrobiales bacterium]MDA9904777.1 phosphoribosylformylglycinamidine synthase subunit PurQ [Hyphomicrobiales bacterium]|tara:strand:- start:839 stop:1528 length:690 start_codon:yes stop_codon:yes gene_type:complete
MRVSVIVFPGSNCDRDVAVSLKKFSNKSPLMIWHKETSLPDSDLIVLPGGFSYGDYLRCGSMAANSPIMKEVKKSAEKGSSILGICNGFQILTESGLLPGTLIRNQGLSFICKNTSLKVENDKSFFTHNYNKNEIVNIPIAHNEGNYFADENVIKDIEDKNLVAFRYCNKNGDINEETNPNGSLKNIAGIINEKGNVLGMMPHPERATDDITGLNDGEKFFTSIIESIK